MGAKIPLRNFSQVERGIEQALRNFAHAEVNSSELPAITAAEGIDKGNISALAIAEASETTANDIEQAGQAAVEIAAEIVKEAQQLAAGLRGIPTVPGTAVSPWRASPVSGAAETINDSET